jgi:hypothetical protein
MFWSTPLHHLPGLGETKLIIAAYCVVATESAGRQIPMAFLEMIKEEFNRRYSGGEAGTATANSLTRDFG